MNYEFWDSRMANCTNELSYRNIYYELTEYKKEEPLKLVFESKEIKGFKLKLYSLNEKYFNNNF